jgi:hypothetical protein
VCTACDEVRRQEEGRSKGGEKRRRGRERGEVTSWAEEYGGRVVGGVVSKCQLAADVVRSDRKGWLVCGAVLIVTIVRSGITYSFGQIVVGLESTYHKSLAEQS